MTKCDILVSGETYSRISDAVFCLPFTSHSFSDNAPALFGQPCPCFTSHQLKQARPDSVGALPFKSTIDKAGRCANTRRPLTHTVGVTTMHAANDCTPRNPNEQDLPLELLNRIHAAAQDPTGRLVVALLRQLCPGLTPAVALEWIRADLAFEAEAARQAAELLNGEWSQES